MSDIYDVKIYEKTWGIGTNGTLVAVLDGASGIKIEKSIISQKQHLTFQEEIANCHKLPLAKR